MDGVVADWNMGTAFLKSRPVNQHWTELKLNYPRIYRDLPLTTQAHELVNIARTLRDQNKYNLLFLTAVPKNNDFHWAFYDKVMWAQHYFPDVPVHFGPYSQDKFLHCQPGDILIDDRLDNCQAWTNRQGIAVHITPPDLEPGITLLKSLR